MDAWSISLVSGRPEATVRRRISQWRLGEESEIMLTTQLWLDRQGGAERFGVLGTERNSEGVEQDLHLRVRRQLQPRFRPGALVDWAFVDAAPMTDALAQLLGATR
jgi:hypothetical protein